MLKRVGSVVALLVSMVVLGGCVSIKSVTGLQQDVVGPVRVTVVVCASDRSPTINHPGCDYQSNLGEGVPGSGQLLVALQVPEGTVAPQSVPGTTNDASASTLGLTRDPTYEAELVRLLPAAGRTWVGYRSSVYDYDAGLNGTPAREVSIPIDLTPPRSVDGAPYVGPLPVLPVAGGRVVSASASEARPVTCGTSAFASTSDATICVDSPVAALIAASEYSLPTRDFGVLAGKATASPGQTVMLPFNVRGAGALPAGLTAGLSASTGLPGAGAVTPSVASAALANGSDTRVTVPVAIPKAAGPGVFDVTVTGRLENGQVRTGVAKLTVRDRQKPVLTKLRAKPKRFKAATKKRPKRGTNVSFTLSEPASVRLTVQRCAKRAGKRKRGRCVRWKSLKGALVKPGVQGANKIRFNGRLRGKALKAGGYRLVLTPKDEAANVGKAARIAFAVRR
jgi:hypothetical protein